MSKKNLNILIVDDDPLMRDILSDILKSENHIVSIAENGVDAMQYYLSQKDKISLIISDMNMPKMTGLELIKKLRKKEFYVPIIILTNNDEINIAVKALNCGANDYLIKDENIEDTLLLSIRNVIEKQEMKEQNKRLMSDLTIKNSELEKFNDILGNTIKKLTNIGTKLASEKNIYEMQKMIVCEACDITNADSGTLYVVENERLHCHVVQCKPMNIYLQKTSDYTPKPLIDSKIADYCFSQKKVINIPNINKTKNTRLLDFSKKISPKKYQPKTILVVPLIDRENYVIGVLELTDPIDIVTGKITKFHKDKVNIIKSLTSQAAVAITNVRLYEESEHLFESVVEILATALDTKSRFSRGHIKKVVSLTMFLVEEINKADEGYFKDINFTSDELCELKIAALLHDVGKITTPEYVVEKRTKLESIFDRVQFITLRFNWISSEIRYELLEKKYAAVKKGDSIETVESIERCAKKTLKEIADDIKFISEINKPQEYMEDEKLDRLKKIASKTVLIGGKKVFFLNENEVNNLSIRKGSITEDELQIMRDHAEVTIKMLEKLPFSKKFKDVPIYAGGHHEKLDGSGYPHGLKGKQIPLQTRMIALIDLFEALTALDRPYKKAISLKEALEVINEAVEDNHIDGNLFKFFKEKKIYEKIVSQEEKFW